MNKDKLERIPENLSDDLSLDDRDVIDIIPSNASYYDNNNMTNTNNTNTNTNNKNNLNNNNNNNKNNSNNNKNKNETNTQSVDITDTDDEDMYSESNNNNNNNNNNTKNNSNNTNNNLTHTDDMTPPHKKVIITNDITTESQSSLRRSLQAVRLTPALERIPRRPQFALLTKHKKPHKQQKEEEVIPTVYTTVQHYTWKEIDTTKWPAPQECEEVTIKSGYSRSGEVISLTHYHTTNTYTTKQTDLLKFLLHKPTTNLPQYASYKKRYKLDTKANGTSQQVQITEGQSAKSARSAKGGRVPVVVATSNVRNFLLYERTLHHIPLNTFQIVQIKMPRVYVENKDSLLGLHPVTLQIPCDLNTPVIFINGYNPQRLEIKLPVPRWKYSFNLQKFDKVVISGNLNDVNYEIRMSDDTIYFNHMPLIHTGFGWLYQAENRREDPEWSGEVNVTNL